MQVMQQAVADHQISLDCRRRQRQCLLLIPQALSHQTGILTPDLGHSKHALSGIHPQNTTVRPALGQPQTDIARTATEINQTSLMAKVHIIAVKQLLNAIHHGLIGSVEISRRIGLHLQRVIHDLRFKNAGNHQVVGLDCSSSVCVG